MQIGWTQTRHTSVALISASVAGFGLLLMASTTAATWIWQIKRPDGSLFQGAEPSREKAMTTVETVLLRLLDRT
ncbi:hypothetical protein [Paracraurococcus ruber]|uniref:Uncharacterized protein n=1 Tax=Paracraurococcus ruber TaxID=77675 RepID=A0ABS1CR93_9PROT|nr:hypothetical protein [Paracraurococcus ruber]MBK1656878.1 hypothetical protein [Paracraurococcus ruber]TDG33991.1 hypothetical protein E2C05_01755 [Paracraurococcus ruber]